MPVDTYYFDGHTSITDANNVWSNDANAFDGNTTDSATTTSGGSSDVRNLIGTGTTAPTSGGNITQVRARLFANADTSQAFHDLVQADIKDGSTSLGTPIGANNATAAFGSYVTLSAPSGGWTWTKVNGLIADIKRQTAIGGNATGAYKVEIEVTSDAAGSASASISPSPSLSISSSISPSPSSSVSPSSSISASVSPSSSVSASPSPSATQETLAVDYWNVSFPTAIPNKIVMVNQTINRSNTY
jgi:hypothetical protein